VSPYGKKAKSREEEDNEEKGNQEAKSVAF